MYCFQIIHLLYTVWIYARKGTTDAIFTVQQMQEKYGCKGKKLYFAFVDLEKAFDRVPREVTRWAIRKAGVDEWLVKAVMVMYEGAQTVVRTTGYSKAFNVKVGLHQGSVLSPLLFVIVMEMNFQRAMSRFAYRITVCR